MTTSPALRDDTTRLPFLLAIALGEVAGLVLFAAAALSAGAGAAVRAGASVLLGRAAFDEEALNIWGAVTMALLAHLLLCGLFGWLYGVFHRTMVPATRVRYGAQAIAGLFFGLGLWFVDVQLVGRAGLEWFLELPQGRLAALHALFFGLPLGLAAAAASRARARRLAAREAPATTPQPEPAATR